MLAYVHLWFMRQTNCEPLQIRSLQFLVADEDDVFRRFCIREFRTWTPVSSIEMWSAPHVFVHCWSVLCGESNPNNVKRKFLTGWDYSRKRNHIITYGPKPTVFYLINTHYNLQIHAVDSHNTWNSVSSSCLLLSCAVTCSIVCHNFTEYMKNEKIPPKQRKPSKRVKI